MTKRSRLGVALPIVILLVVVVSVIVALTLTNYQAIVQKFRGIPNTILNVKLQKSDSKYMLVFKCLGGDEINLKDIEVIVSYKGGNFIYKYPFSYMENEILRAEESFGVLLNLSLERGDLLDVKVVHLPSSYTLLEREIVVGVTVTPTPTATLPIPPNSSYLVFNVDKNRWYRTIKEAIKDAESGNTILVYPGYREKESLTIDKSLKIEAVEVGNATIVGSITVSKGGVTIEGFNIKGYLRVYGGSCKIVENKISSNYHGVDLRNAKDVTLVGNQIDSPYCVWIHHGSNVTLKGNKITGYYGVYAYRSDNIAITSNYFSTSYGILTYHSKKVEIAKNDMKCRYFGYRGYRTSDVRIYSNYLEGRYGVYLYRCENVTEFGENNVKINGRYGAGLSFYDCSSKELKIYDNKLTGGSTGIYAYKFNGKISIHGNTISNIRYGAYLIRVREVDVNSNEFKDVSYNALTLYLTSNCSISENVFEGCKCGVSVSDVNGLKIYGNTLRDVKDGLIVRSSENTDISRNRIEGRGYEGVRIDRCGNVKLESNEVLGYRLGIYGFYSRNVVLTSNDIKDGYSSVYFYRFNNVKIFGNNFDKTRKAISLYSSSNVVVSKNKARGSYVGYYMIHCEEVTLSDNEVRGFRYGVYSYRCKGVNLKSNTFESTRQSISIMRDYKDTIEGNVVRDSNIGIYMYRAHENVLKDNAIESNDLGLRLYRSSGNLIYNNLFNNTRNVDVIGKDKNSWNVSKTLGINVVGGKYIGGNAWLSPKGNGFSQTCEDRDGDGICDRPYEINKWNVDYLPLKVR